MMQRRWILAVMAVPCLSVLDVGCSRQWEYDPTGHGYREWIIVLGENEFCGFQYKKLEDLGLSPEERSPQKYWQAQAGRSSWRPMQDLHVYLIDRFRVRRNGTVFLWSMTGDRDALTDAGIRILKLGIACYGDPVALDYENAGADPLKEVLSQLPRRTPNPRIHKDGAS